MRQSDIKWHLLNWLLIFDTFSGCTIRGLHGLFLNETPRRFLSEPGLGMCQCCGLYCRGRKTRFGEVKLRWVKPQTIADFFDVQDVVLQFHVHFSAPRVYAVIFFADARYNSWKLNPKTCGSWRCQTWAVKRPKRYLSCTTKQTFGKSRSTGCHVCQNQAVLSTKQMEHLELVVLSDAPRAGCASVAYQALRVEPWLERPKRTL